MIPPRPGARLEAGGRAAPLARTIAFAQSLAAPEEALALLLLGAAAASAPILGFSCEAPEPSRRPPPLLRLEAWGEAPDRLAAPEDSLTAHVAAQIPLLVRDPRLRPLAEAWLETLEPTGWTSAAPREIARQTERKAEEAEAALRLLQEAEPAGLFARSLRECLELQLRAAEALTAPMAALLDHLPLLAEGRLADLTRILGIAPEALAGLVGRLRRLNPKPGASFGHGPAPLPAPDLIFSHDGIGWNLRRGTWLAPQRIPGAAAETEAAREILRRLEGWERRDRILAETVRAVLEAQKPYLTGRQESPAAVTPKGIAALLGLHETSVRRIRRHLVLEIGGRGLRLRDLFQPEAAPGGAVSVAAVRARIAALVKAESPEAPLSDGALTEILRLEGAPLARRTVAKHRSALGLPEARLRRP